MFIGRGDELKLLNGLFDLKKASISKILRADQR